MRFPRSTHPYIPIKRGFLYLVAIMDWYSRKVLAWRISNTMDAEFCVEALKEALAQYGKPEIFNTDQGSQFTSFLFTNLNNFENGIQTKSTIGNWMAHYNMTRPHSTSDGQTPHEVYTKITPWGTPFRQHYFFLLIAIEIDMLLTEPRLRTNNFLIRS